MPSPKRVGHVVLNVSDHAASTKWYTEVLGFDVSIDRPGFGTFLTCGKIHHDIALFQAKPGAAPVQEGALGINHIALQVDNFDTLTEFWHKLNDAKVAGLRTTDHSMTKSIYLQDPDGIGLELFCNSQDTAEEGLAEMRSPGRTNKELVFS